MTPRTLFFRGQHPHAAFSLIELLLVVVVLGILLAVSGPVLLSALRSSKINQGGQMIGDQMALARQEALTRNREVQVRFYSIGEGQDAGWRAVQIWRLETADDGSITEVPVNRLQRLPESIAISGDPALSPLLNADPVVSGKGEIAGLETPYRGFRFLPSGGTDSSVVVTNNFLTLYPAGDDPASPRNFYTLQVHPLTGKVSVFRP